MIILEVEYITLVAIPSIINYFQFEVNNCIYNTSLVAHEPPVVWPTHEPPSVV